ncbi:MAG TPA: carbonic anhydrase [Patescibacteria group bacterium]|jgi:carbonic anhydrase|nr:carbonic anhydrase [Patescibacteria group bacterium]
MADLDETFFTSVGCMDGRVQAPIAAYGQKKYGVLYPDTITEAGLVGLLANNPSVELLDSIKQKVLISVEKHHSKGIIVHGHQHCAGNPIEDELHKEQAITAAAVIRNFVSEDIEVKPVFVNKTVGGWEVEEL